VTAQGGNERDLISFLARRILFASTESKLLRSYLKEWSTNLRRQARVCRIIQESEMNARGSITQLLRNRRPGYILSEDGCLVAFDESSLQGLDLRELSVGDW